VVADFENRLGTELDVQVATSTTDLDATTLHLRASETNIGNLFADAIRASVGADIALVNSGAIRGERIYPAGALTRRLLLAMHPFGNLVANSSSPDGPCRRRSTTACRSCRKRLAFFPRCRA
jgi:2',3'-cyclic-nucleotide 2'-phosphodiesterase (5'-nucleotidase family)